MSDLIERLRDKARLRAAHGLTGWVLAEEALLAQAAGEIERLTAALKRANDQAEHFERRWYLRGDEIERLTAERDDLRRQLAEAELDAQRYRWLRGDSCPDHSVRWTQWEVRCWRAPQWTADLRRSALDAAIDAAMGASNE